MARELGPYTRRTSAMSKHRTIGKRPPEPTTEKTATPEPPSTGEGMVRRSARWALIAVLVAVIGFALVVVVLRLMDRAHRGDTGEISALIQDEARCLLDRDLKAYRGLFDIHAIIIDKQHNLSWAGQEKIEERARPLRFSLLSHTVQDIDINGDTASAHTITTFAQTEPDPLVSDSSEEWRLAKTGGKWKIESFQYGLPEKQGPLKRLLRWLWDLPSQKALIALFIAVIAPLLAAAAGKLIGGLPKHKEKNGGSPRKRRSGRSKLSNTSAETDSGTDRDLSHGKANQQ